MNLAFQRIILHLQVPPQKVFGPSKPNPNTFSEGTWRPSTSTTIRDRPRCLVPAAGDRSSVVRAEGKAAGGADRQLLADLERKVVWGVKSPDQSMNPYESIFRSWESYSMQFVMLKAIINSDHQQRLSWDRSKHDFSADADQSCLGAWWVAGQFLPLALASRASFSKPLSWWKSERSIILDHPKSLIANHLTVVS